MTSDDDQSTSATIAGADLAWSLDDDDVAPVGQRWGVVLCLAAAVLLACVAIAVLIGRINRGEVSDKLSLTERAPSPSSSVMVKTTATPAVAPTPTVAPPRTVTVQAAPTTVTVEASPSETTTVRAAATTAPTEEPLSESVYDERFLADMRSLGYRVTNRQLALSWAHETCRLFRLGESVDQVNRQIAIETGASRGDVLQLTSSAMLSYPDCA